MTQPIYTTAADFTKSAENFLQTDRSHTTGLFAGYLTSEAIKMWGQLAEGFTAVVAAGGTIPSDLTQRLADTAKRDGFLVMDDEKLELVCPKGKRPFGLALGSSK